MILLQRSSYSVLSVPKPGDLDLQSFIWQGGMTRRLCLISVILQRTSYAFKKIRTQNPPAFKNSDTPQLTATIETKTRSYATFRMPFSL